jgi:cytochrome c oxidase cbb3-type subunit I
VWLGACERQEPLHNFDGKARYMRNGSLAVAVSVAAFLALLGAALGQDVGFRTHAWVAFVALLAGAFLLFRLVSYAPATAGGSILADDQHRYMDSVVRYGIIATLFWGFAGLLVGVIVASQLAWPELNIQPWFNFGRLRPLHTSAVVFAFGGNALLATSFYVVQRTTRARLWGGLLPWFVFWGYQFFIVLAATGYLLGITQSREYAEPEWYVDIWITIVWVAYLLVFLGTLVKRKEPHIYVANWFYLSFIITVAMLHLVNNLAVPVSPLSAKSYSLFSGVQDALTQWWYGHNAVGFFLTAGFLGMMYYFVPKQANRPVYSYRLSIIHFWALIFMYIWAGPHHLHYTALPDWAQTLGMVFSIMLWMPSWGGMINGLMTLSGAWDKLRTDPILRMFVMSLAFYGMSTFEGPLMSIKAVNSLSHYTDWTIGHVHSGALGWVGMVSFGAIYHLVPKLWGRTQLYSLRLVNWHLWLATLGIVVYAGVMWVSGIMQGLMWREYDDQGFLVYSFAETTAAMYPYYVMRVLGGVLYLAGLFVMIFNVWKTIRGDVREEIPMGAEAPALQPAE